MIDLDGTQPLDDARIAELERELGARFPKPFRKFLAMSNGGRPREDNELRTATGVDLGVGVDEFYGIRDRPEVDLRAQRGALADVPGSDGLLPVAAAAAGNVIALQLEKPHHVVFFDHEEGRLHDLGLQFDRFLKKLAPTDGDLGEPAVSSWVDPSMRQFQEE